MSRTLAREVAMKMEYSKLLGGSETPESVLEKTETEAKLDQEDIDFANELVAGIDADRDRIDALIEKYAVGWSFERIAKVDLCILRLSVFEMLSRDDVPTGASINEAVELAKKYGGEKSFAFVNGILGSVAKELEE